MTPAAQIAWLIGMIPGGIAVYWAYKRWRHDDSPEAPKYFRKFLVWGALSFIFWAIGVALDIHAGNP
jgi:type IV secretory pathway TrbL component